MSKDAYINARIDRRLKARAERILSQVGITTTDAITMLLHQIVLRDGLPFEARIPNKETVSAMAELERGAGEKFTGSAKQLLAKLTRSRKRRGS
jgi:DNA-damage-inducible protein J